MVWDGHAYRSILTTICVPGDQAKAKILVVRDIERDDIEFISKTLGCLPIAHVDHMRPEKLGHAGLVEEQTVRSCAWPHHCILQPDGALCGDQLPRPLGLLCSARHQQPGSLRSDPPFQSRLLLEGLTINF